MSNKIMKCLAASLVAVVAGCVCESKDPLALNGVARDSGTHYVAEALKPYLESGELPGTVVIAYDNGMQETACVGYADPETKRPVTVDDPYMQCSQTKGFCGVTVAMLVEDGKLKLDDPVGKYLPEFNDLVWVLDGESNGVRRLRRPQTPITLRMCLNHTAGFGFEVQAKAQEIRGGGWTGGMPLRAVAATAASGFPLNFEPGTGHQYSNTGIDVAAAVVEEVSGMRWEEFLQKRLFDPLGMKDTGFWPTDDQIARRIRLCRTAKDKKPELSESGWAQQPFNDRHVFAGAGAGLWTTARDQLRFYKMLMNLGLGENGVRVMKEETVRTLLAVSSTPKGRYSLGLSAPNPDEDNANAWFGHGGAFSTSCMVNWHKKQLKLVARQIDADYSEIPWNGVQGAAVEKFFKSRIDTTQVDAYTGRTK